MHDKMKIGKKIELLNIRLRSAKTDREAIQIRRLLREAGNAYMKQGVK